MATLQDRQQIQVRPAIVSSTSNTILLVIAAAIILLHPFTNSRYGFHRDELQFLVDAQPLDWRFVVYPPVTPPLDLRLWSTARPWPIFWEQMRSFG